MSSDKSHHFKEEHFGIQHTNKVKAGRFKRSLPALYPVGHAQIFWGTKRLSL
jgi:hypothetical protein